MQHPRRLGSLRTIFSVASLLLLFASCARNPISGKREFAIDEDKEIALGKANDPQIVASMGLYDDAQLQATITRLGLAMARASERPNLDWTFRIVDSDVVNAFAVPGGYVYFTRGILAHFNNEAEFAGVLGHEIGHVTARHSAQQIQKQRLAQVGMVAGALASNTVRQNFDAVSQGMQLLFLKYGRDAESQSDELGVKYSTAQGYDAIYMAGFFETINRIQEQAGVEVPDFLSTHPNPLNREARVKKLAAEYQAKTPGTEDKVNRDGYLRLIDGLVFGTDPKQGFTENGKFYHPELKFQFDVPKGWALLNSPQAVQMQPKEGDAAIIFSLAQGDSPEAAAQAWAQQNEVQPQGGRATTINGMPAYVLSGRAGDGQQSQVIDYQVTFIKMGGNIYNFTEFALATANGKYARVLDGPTQSFRALTEARYLNRQPDRIAIKAVGSTTTLGNFLKQQGTAEDKLNEVAILNGMKLTDSVAAGMLVKTVTRGAR